jgi:hypothetical protein
MKQGLLLHRVYILAKGASVHQRVKRSAPILTHLADTFTAVEDHTTMSAQIAAHLVIAQCFVQQCLFSFHYFSVMFLPHFCYLSGWRRTVRPRIPKRHVPGKSVGVRACLPAGC